MKPYTRSFSPIYNSEPTSPRIHMRVTSSPSPVQESSHSFSLNEYRNSRYNPLLETQNQYLHYDSDDINNNKVFFFCLYYI